jgi:CPA2 family monovalent cation:H+ antiporter-2
MTGHDTPLIAMIAAGLVLAFLFGMLAHRLRLSPLVGYLAAGVVVGPFTPGFVADPELASELAEIGIILLMFGVGLHFSPHELMAVRAIAVPGAVVQVAVATLLGMALAWWLGWGIGAGIVFGLALAVASTVVVVRALQERHILESERGRITVGWLIVEDLVTVLALVLLPSLAPLLAGEARLPLGEIVATISFTLLQVAAFVAVMLVAGRRLIPWVMHHAAHTGSRELFRLAVYAIALGVAFGAAKLFEVSFALGAFFAGMVMGESRLSQRAAEEALPLRDAFAVLFFVSVGMLFDPSVLIEAPIAVIATLLIIVLGNSLAAFAFVRAFGLPVGTAITVAVALAQIGEFSFILAGLGVALGVLPAEGRDLILAGAILSITLNPFLFGAVERGRTKLLTRIQFTTDAPAPNPAPAAPPSPAKPEPEPEAPVVTTLTDHDILVGYGAVGALVGPGLIAAGRPLLVITEEDEAAEAAREAGAEVLVGNAASPEVLAAANLPAARRLFCTLPETFEAGQVVQQGRAANPRIEIFARAQSDEAVTYLADLGADTTVLGEREIATRLLQQAGTPPPSAAG